MHETRLKCGKPFYFRINVSEVSSANLAIRVNLRSHEEVELAVRKISRAESQIPIEHLPIPFQMCLSTELEKPSTQTAGCTVH